MPSATTYTIVSVRQDNTHVTATGMVVCQNVSDYLDILVRRTGYRYAQHIVISTDAHDNVVLLDIYNSSGILTKRLAVRGDDNVSESPP